MGGGAGVARRLAMWLALVAGCSLLVRLLVLPHATSAHALLGTYIKNIHYGGMDGVVTTFSVVAGVEGASLSPRVTLVLGFASLFADALSMGVGEFVSARAELEYAEDAGQHRVAGAPLLPVEAEARADRDELQSALHEAGAAPAEAERLANAWLARRLAKTAAADPGDAPTPLKRAVVTFCSFLVFGSVPLVAYVGRAASLARASQSVVFANAVALTSVALFALGCVKALFISRDSWWRAGLAVVAYGELTAATAYAIGWLIDAVVQKEAPPVAATPVAGAPAPSPSPMSLEHHHYHYRGRVVAAAAAAQTPPTQPPVRAEDRHFPVAAGDAPPPPVPQLLGVPRTRAAQRAAGPARRS